MRNLTAVGKFLILTVLLGSITACSSNSPYQSSSVYAPVVSPYDSSTASLYLAYKQVLESNYRLDNEQKNKQTGAVYSALDSEYGVVYKWFHGDAMGAVKAVHGYPQGSGYCKVIYSTVIIRDKQRNFEETACKEEGHQGWRFIVM